MYMIVDLESKKIIIIIICTVSTLFQDPNIKNLSENDIVVIKYGNYI